MNITTHHLLRNLSCHCTRNTSCRCAENSGWQGKPGKVTLDGTFNPDSLLDGLWDDWIGHEQRRYTALSVEYSARIIC
jgi:hypothetical protein